MTDDGPWNLAAGRAREKQRRVVCGPAGTDRDTLADEFQQTHNVGGVPPGSIVRLRGLSGQLPAIVQPGRAHQTERHLYSAGACCRRRRRRRLALCGILHRQHPQPQHAARLCAGVRPVLRVVRRPRPDADDDPAA